MVMMLFPGKFIPVWLTGHRDCLKRSGFYKGLNVSVNCGYANVWRAGFSCIQGLLRAQGSRGNPKGFQN